MSKLFSFLFITISLFFIVSCDKEAVYRESIIIPNSLWMYENMVDFEFEIKDTSERYDIWLGITHSDTFAYQNIYVKIHSSFPPTSNLSDTTQVVSLELAAPSGKWKGDCGSGTCILRIPIQRETFFPAKGNYGLKIENFMRETPIVGIQKLSLRIEKYEPE